jgi:signal transduction histidine kinase
MTDWSRRRARAVAGAAFVSAVRLAALALIVAGVYALVVLGIGQVPSSTQWTVIGLSALAAAVAALIYARVRERVTAWAGSFIDPTRAHPQEVARMFSRRTSGGATLDELLPALLETLRVGLGATAAEVWTASGGVLALTAAEPARGRSTVTLGAQEMSLLTRAGVVGGSWLALWLPAIAADRDSGELRAVSMIHGGELVGLLIAVREEGAPPFTTDEDDALVLLSRQAALAFGNVRLGSALDASMDALRRNAEALQESRARVVAAGDAERRRIERDLHDGAQQHLLGLAVNLKVARELAASDPEQADAILAELASEIHAALEQLRELAHGIYPPLLMERGLPDAVETALRRTGLPGRVRAEAVGRYPLDIEATVYFCCVEAIQNAAKHVPGAAVEIRIWSEHDALLFEVADSGRGFDPAIAHEGAGITNMRDRVGAHGGTLLVDARGGAGTRVTGAVPTVSDPARADTRALP